MQLIEAKISPVELGSKLREIFKERGVVQPLIEDKTGVSQSQISRIFNGKFCLTSGHNVRKLCEYAEILIIEEEREAPDPRKSELLIGALQDIWDGSRQKEKALAKLIRSLEPLLK